MIEEEEKMNLVNFKSQMPYKPIINSAYSAPCGNFDYVQ